MLTQSDIVFAGEKDATLMFGITSEYDVNSFDYQRDILSKFRKMFDIRVIAGTHRDTDTGSLLGYLLNEKGFYQSRVHTFDVYDRIGGGDAFTAGMIHALYHMEDTSKKVEYATCSRGYWGIQLMVTALCYQNRIFCIIWNMEKVMLLDKENPRLSLGGDFLCSLLDYFILLSVHSLPSSKTAEINEIHQSFLLFDNLKILLNSFFISFIHK